MNAMGERAGVVPRTRGPERRPSGRPDALPVEALMTGTVVTILPDVPVREAARLMVERGVGSLPVVEGNGSLEGIVTRSDLTARLTSRRPRWWHAFSADPVRAAREYRRATGTTVREVMSRPVVTVASACPVGEAVALLEEHRIGRLPVLAGNRLAGIVTRSDLVQALAAAPARVPPRSDADLAADMRARLAAEWWAARGLFVDSEDGVLRLYGLVDGEAQGAAIETMARAIPGSRGVESHLVDRRTLPPAVV
jgi:CBS domain-containing protein